VAAAGGGYAAVGWGRSLEPLEALAIAIPSAALLCVGGQTILTSFLLSFIGLGRRRSGPAEAGTPPRVLELRDSAHGSDPNPVTPE
jgi:hypothetical protein